MELKYYPDLIKISDAARLLQVSSFTLKRWEKVGKINPVRINARGDRRYKKEDIEQLMEI